MSIEIVGFVARVLTIREPRPAVSAVCAKATFVRLGDVTVATVVADAVVCVASAGVLAHP
jgi:hypothetical protein